MAKATRAFASTFGTLCLLAVSLIIYASAKRPAPDAPVVLQPVAPPQLSLFGVEATFEIAPPTISLRDRVRVELMLTNPTSSDITLKYMSCFESHFQLFTEQGKLIAWKDGAPIPECGYTEVQIKAKGAVQKTEEFAFGDYYAVPAGRYVAGLIFDKRLMESVPPGSAPWTAWTGTKRVLRIK